MGDLGGEAGGVLDAPGANSRGHDGQLGSEEKGSGGIGGRGEVC